MRQIIQSYRTGELWLGDVPAPALRGGGAIVRTAASVISAGTERMVIELAKKSLLGKARARPDLVRKVIGKIKTQGLAQTMQQVAGKLDTPIPLGYSCAGSVVEVGGGADFKVGDRVACAGAGYATHAEYNFVPKNLLAKIPDGVSFEDAAFTTLGAIAMQGVRQADLRLGERVVVIGLGLLGLLTVQLLKASGCRVLGSDPNPSRCELAKALGADDAVTQDVIDAAAAFTDGRGADAIIITAATSSNAPIETAAEISRVRGRVIVVGVVGMNVPREPFYKKELDLRLSMSYGPGRYDPNFEEAGHDYPFGYVRWTEQRNMQSFLELVAAGKVTPAKLVTHRFDITDALRGYELLESGAEPYLGIVITYPETVAAPHRTVALRPCKPSAKIVVGLIGAGNFAKGVLLPAIKRCKGIELAGVCTSTGMSAAETAKKHGFAYATTDAAKILGDASLNTIFIATRHDSHAKLACAALAAGKHVFVEKPLCMKPDELEIYEQALSGNGGAVLMVGFNRRFSPHAIAVRDAFAKRITPAMITYRINAGAIPDDSWIQNGDIGGGRIIGEVCHFIDLCEFLTGSPALSVRADSSAAKDNLAIGVSYQDGSLASIQFTSLGPADLPKERIEFFAGGAASVIDDFSRTSFHGLRRRGLRGRQDKGIDGEIAAFFRAIREGLPPPIPVDSIFRTTRMTFGVLDSLRTGNAVQPDAQGAQTDSCPPCEPSEPSDTCVRASS